MTLNDLEHLPKIVTDIRGINDVLLAIDPEITLLRNDISQTLKEIYIKTTENAIRRWEIDFSIPYDSSLSLAQRRQAILDKLAKKQMLTDSNLRKLIRMNITNPQFYLINDSADYHFRIYIFDNDYTGLQKAIDSAKPAYLTFDVIVTQIAKRCGTFDCGTLQVL